jgi:ubiquinol-cytochrome c reductase iron-sulfur subunit
MSDENQVDSSRRGLLVATAAAGGIAGVAGAGAFVATFEPSERAKAAGAPVEVDVADLKPGEMKTVEWRGKPVWVLRRTPEMVASLQKTGGDLADPKSERNADDLTPAYARNEHRSIKPEFLVAVGICSHLGRNSRPGHSHRYRAIGRAGSCVHVMVRHLILPGECSRTNLLLITCRFHVTCTPVIPAS